MCIRDRAAGALQVTRADVFDTDTTPVTTGVDGADWVGTNGDDETDGLLVPAALVAETLTE